MSVSRIALIVLGIVVLAGIALALFQVAAIMAAVSTSKKLMESAVPYTQHPANPTMHILVVGDSTAVGTGAIDPKDSVAGRLGSYYPTADIENNSKNGLRVAGLAALVETLPEKHYDLLMIHIGGNDVTMLTSQESVKSSLDSVLTWASAHATKVIVIAEGNIGLSPVFKFPLSQFLTARTIAVQNIFKQEIAKYPNVAYLDLFNKRADEPFNKDVKRYYAPDYFHPSGEGYGLWFEKLKGVLP